MNLGVIVEGHGEVDAAPVLLRRMLAVIDPRSAVFILPPDRKKRAQLAKEDEFKRALDAMARRVGPEGVILVVLDADDDAACVLGPQLSSWAAEVRPDRRTAVVVAEREWEAWYLEAVESLRGKRGLAADVSRPNGPERLRDAKGWLGSRMSNGYSETLDQAAFAAELDLQAASGSYSFAKLQRELARLVGAPAAPEPA